MTLLKLTLLSLIAIINAYMILSAIYHHTTIGYLITLHITLLSIPYYIKIIEDIT